jgi:signal transduction histidine kinase
VATTVSPFKVGNEFIGATIVFRDVTREREIDKAKTEFVSLASHELRTPLTAIDGLVSMILEGEYGEVNNNLKQPLADVNISSERLIHLVNDLLNLSRIQAGKMKYILSDFPIADVIIEAVHLLQPLSEQKRLQLTTAKLESILVQGDLDKVKQVLNNLIGNSLKFTDKGNITISVKSEEDKINVYIADTGIGIAKEDQNKMFGKFEQLESAIGRPTGTGLGLHISREMTRKMGGELWLEKSEMGSGSTFAFSLPKAKSALAGKVKKEIGEEVKTNPDQKSDIIMQEKKA